MTLRIMHLLANAALLLILVYCAFLQYTQKAVANVPFHLLSATIFLKLFKTELQKTEIFFLGHLVTSNRLKVDPEKLKAVPKMLKPEKMWKV